MDVSGPGGRPLDPDARVPVLFGYALAFADNLGAGDILPVRAAVVPAAEAARTLFADLDPALAPRLAAGTVLVAGQRTGHGDGGAAAARALAAAGIVAVVAGSFADGFDEHCLAAGLPPFEVDAPSMFHTGQRMRMNCEAGTIANLSSGDRLPIRNATEAMLERLRAILDR
jgi:3-isopropylmalate dehydratase small subunit